MVYELIVLNWLVLCLITVLVSWLVDWLVEWLITEIKLMKQKWFSYYTLLKLSTLISNGSLWPGHNNALNTYRAFQCESSGSESSGTLDIWPLEVAAGSILVPNCDCSTDSGNCLHSTKGVQVAIKSNRLYCNRIETLFSWISFSWQEHTMTYICTGSHGLNSSRIASFFSESGKKMT